MGHLMSPGPLPCETHLTRRCSKFRLQTLSITVTTAITDNVTVVHHLGAVEKNGKEWKRMEKNGKEWKRMEKNGKEWKRAPPILTICEHLLKSVNIRITSHFLGGPVYLQAEKSVHLSLKAFHANAQSSLQKHAAMVCTTAICQKHFCKGLR